MSKNFNEQQKIYEEAQRSNLNDKVEGCQWVPAIAFLALLRGKSETR
ncbi:MAG: hypothetical protein IKW26_08800 [Treponema sp.]|nr:hypothetical protein [Treponema sp.]